MSERARVGLLSLGCPKALVDAEHIVTGLAADGYDIVSAEEASDVLVINTCGFIEAAKDESLDAIEAALETGREVVVTGCMGADAAALRKRFPGLRHVSGPADVAPVLDAVQQFVPAGPADRPAGAEGLFGEARVRLTPGHYGYLKISEGCNHKCRFCIIPQMRGPLVSRDVAEVLVEAEAMVADGVQELLVVAQDLSAYGLDIGYRDSRFQGQAVVARLETLAVELGAIAPWVRLHYVYPYPHVDRLIPLMADGVLLPYLDMPLQHASPRVLKAMRRPAASEKTLERLLAWREQCPDLCIRSSFVVGFPGETEDDVGELLDFLEAAQLDRVGCFTYSDVDGAAANALPDQVDERDKLDRQEMVYETQASISRARLARHVGRVLRVLVDDTERLPDGGWQLTARSQFDAPEIDGVVHVRADTAVPVGEFAWVAVEDHDDHDLVGKLAGQPLSLT